MSIFDPNAQKTDIDSKLLATLEKFSDLFRVLLWDATQKYQASPLQIQVLIFLHFHQNAPEHCTNSNLAREFSVTKATMSETANTLVKKGLIVKTPAAGDKRSRHLGLTNEGEQLAHRVSGFADALKTPLSGMDTGEKMKVFEFLLQFLHQINKDGLISVERMCFGCPYYEGDRKNAHFCHLMQSALATGELRFDCDLVEVDG